jgi:hypothetical protein
MTAAELDRLSLGHPIAQMGNDDGLADLGDAELQSRPASLPYFGHSHPKVPAVNSA